MLVLMCRAGDNRYAIDSACVVEVVPYVHTDSVADAPPWLAGVFAYRGRATPLVDLTLLTSGQTCPRLWSNRIIVARFDAPDMPSQLGLLAERVTTAEIDATAQTASTDESAGMETLGPLLLDDQPRPRSLDPVGVDAVIESFLRNEHKRYSVQQRRRASSVTSVADDNRRPRQDMRLLHVFLDANPFGKSAKECRVDPTRTFWTNRD